MDLKKWLPKELINEYDTRFFIPACIYKDKLVGLVIIFFSLFIKINIKYVIYIIIIIIIIINKYIYL